LNGPILDLIAPIRPLQLCADGGYQLRFRGLEGTPNYGPRQPRAQQEAPPRPTLGLGLDLGLRRRSPPRPTPGLGLDIGLGKSHIFARPWASAPASTDLRLGSTVPQGMHHYPTPS
jgi:hypothetical protein